MSSLMYVRTGQIRNVGGNASRSGAPEARVRKQSRLTTQCLLATTGAHA
jgi:hypothetical protein